MIGHLGIGRDALNALGTALAAGLMVAVGLTALSGPGLAQGLSADEPIEINADSLQVRREERLAIFNGNVDVVQGELRLKADRLSVHYREGGDKSAAATIQGAISQLDAEGNVFVSSPRETAQGQRGTYDVVNRQITLAGDVVLTRGQNVLRGARLVMNLATGVSTMESGTEVGGRVRGLFVPENGN